MKSFTTSLLLISILAFACTKKEDAGAAKKLIEPKTPDVLKETNSRSSLGSVSKRYKEDIIQRLYEEALENDPELKKLDEQLNKLSKISNDSLQGFYQYQKTNENYWTESDFYINRIQDSTTREFIGKFMMNEKNKYLESIQQISTKVDSIQAKNLLLADQHILMKLFITYDMMKNYQHNEKPNEAPIDYIHKSQDELIQKSKQYTNPK